MAYPHIPNFIRQRQVENEALGFARDGTGGGGPEFLAWFGSLAPEEQSCVLTLGERLLAYFSALPQHGRS